ncbi:cg30 [Hemileuca sp. nucleopolyhedrovirus]|uniref:Cg30 n=1 Tax=Hemileuca sp. nucleopolyhedrovirus TaxID=1367203 RepID=S5MQ79_9ABAC|nr:cg30 [Hemileuca sp. nucleopolyhedrovirus]AGR56828.1 cg30 [Hemileuca sp. nucleopolyhedrovirus]
MASVTLCCSVCFANSKIVYKKNDEDFLTVLPLAKLLPCKHSLCLTCINSIKGDGDEIVCPMCRQRTYRIGMYSINRENVTIIESFMNIKNLCKSVNCIDGVEFTKVFFENNVVEEAQISRVNSNIVGEKCIQTDDSGDNNSYDSLNKSILENYILIQNQHKIMANNTNMIREQSEHIKKNSTILSEQKRRIATNNATHTMFLRNRMNNIRLVEANKRLIEESKYINKQLAVMKMEKNRLRKEINEKANLIKQIDQMIKCKCDNDGLPSINDVRKCLQNAKSRNSDGVLKCKNSTNMCCDILSLCSFNKM